MLAILLVCAVLDGEAVSTAASMDAVALAVAPAVLDTLVVASAVFDALASAPAAFGTLGALASAASESMV